MQCINYCALMHFLQQPFSNQSIISNTVTLRVQKCQSLQEQPFMSPFIKPCRKTLNVCVSLLHSLLGSFHLAQLLSYCCYMPVQGMVLHSAPSFFISYTGRQNHPFYCVLSSQHYIWLLYHQVCRIQILFIHHYSPKVLCSAESIYFTSCINF